MRISLVSLSALLSFAVFSARAATTCENPAGFLVSRIVNGKTLGSQNPISDRTVLIEFTKANGHIATCTGSILPRNIILTAAHCVGPTPTATRVAFTTNEACLDSQRERVVRRVVATKINPRYTEPGLGPFEGDLALLKFEGSLPKGYTNFPLPGERIEAGINETLFMVGYGRTNADANDSGPLRITSQKITRLKNSDLHEAMISIDQHDQGICAGDSGGPMLVYQNFQYKVVAVASYVYNDDRDISESCNGEAGFIGTEANRDWIQKTFAEMTQP